MVETTSGALAALRKYGILDTPAEPRFDSIVQRAAHALHMPIALVSLLDEHRQWFKARVGLDVAETALSVSFCAHAVRARGVMEIPDARLDERFRENPLVTGSPHIRFYAGAPLTTPDGSRIGTLCVIDREPRAGLTPEEVRTLETLADEVMQVLHDREKTA